MTKLILKILIAIFSVSTLILSYLCISQGLLPFDENGVYFDEHNAVVFRQEGVFIYGVLALLSLIITFILLKCLKVTPQ